MTQFKPLLSVKADFNKIKYPVLATPKLDGIRCCIVDGVAVSRNLKPIPNDFIRNELEGLEDLDGELVLRDLTADFNQVQSAVMSQEGEPDFVYCVFDKFTTPHMSYEERLTELREEYLEHKRFKFVTPVEITDEDMLNKYVDYCVSNGFEGAMIRQPGSIYKFGRSTVNQGILLKIKPFHDDEGEVVEILEAMHNTNKAEKDELGYTKRSSSKQGLVPAGKAGAVLLNWNDKTFKVGFGPGITDEVKKELWENRAKTVGKSVTFKYQELSAEGIPRFGKMIAFRAEGDTDA